VFLRNFTRVFFRVFTFLPDDGKWFAETSFFWINFIVNCCWFMELKPHVGVGGGLGGTGPPQARNLTCGGGTGPPPDRHLIACRYRQLAIPPPPKKSCSRPRMVETHFDHFFVEFTPLEVICYFPYILVTYWFKIQLKHCKYSFNVMLSITLDIHT